MRVTVYLRHREQPLHIPVREDANVTLDKIIQCLRDDVLLIAVSDDTVIMRDEIQAITVEKGR